MAPITNLYAKYHYTGTSLPIVIVMHGWSQGAVDFADATLERMADYGAFVAAVGMRGRDGADGLADASAREIYDIYDAIAYIKTNYSDIVDPAHVCVCGYSGGGGNALAFACKFPDAAQYIVSHFGISDYGYDAVDGWYNTTGNATYQAQMETRIGGDPAAVPNAYRARNAVEAIANYTGGHLWLFHDQDDSVVPIVNSQNIATAMDAASLTNYTANYTSSADATRWLHNLPNAGQPIIQTEPIWLQAVADKTHAAWTVPTSGTVTVLGYIVTKRFTIWLGTGTDEVATVAYDTATGQYTVTPLTGSMDVSITQGALTASQTISSETTLTVS